MGCRRAPSRPRICLPKFNASDFGLSLRGDQSLAPVPIARREMLLPRRAAVCPRRNRLATVVAYHRPRLAVRILRRLSSSAMPFNPVIPPERIASISGRTLAACSSAFAFSRAIPLVLPLRPCSARAPFGQPSLTPRSLADPPAYLPLNTYLYTYLSLASVSPADPPLSSYAAFLCGKNVSRLGCIYCSGCTRLKLLQKRCPQDGVELRA
jgi:hypothetical protein